MQMFSNQSVSHLYFYSCRQSAFDPESEFALQTWYVVVSSIAGYDGKHMMVMCWVLLQTCVPPLLPLLYAYYRPWNVRIYDQVIDYSLRVVPRNQGHLCNLLLSTKIFFFDFLYDVHAK